MKSVTPSWRAVYFIQNLISRFAPPLHSLHWKIFALSLITIFLPGLYIAWEVRHSLERSHLRSTEQGMIDLALLLADAWSKGADPESLSTLQNADATFQSLFQNPINLNVIFYDTNGQKLRFSSGTSETPSPIPSDVKSALSGDYGARWQHDRERNTVFLFSTVPALRDGKLIGAVSIQKATAPIRQSVLESLRDLIIPGILALGFAATASYVLSRYLTQIIGDLAKRARKISDGEPGLRLETWTQSELGDLTRSLETMRQKLEGKTYVEEMATTLSHELKTPLASIRGAAEILEQEASPTIRKKFAENILAETDRLSRTVDNLLALARIETHTVAAQTTSLSQTARKILTTYERRAEQLGLHFQASIQESATRIPVPEDQLTRILEILLDNAFQFTPSGRSVQLETSENSLIVRDEGSGIPLELQEKIFQRFFTTVNPRTQRRGTGLGLAILQSIVQRHHGTIQLESVPGKGSVFSIQFPYSDKAPSHSEQKT